MISVKDISKMFGKKKVVDAVTVDIQPGKITSFI